LWFDRANGKLDQNILKNKVFDALSNGGILFLNIDDSPNIT